MFLISSSLIALFNISKPPGKNNGSSDSKRRKRVDAREERRGRGRASREDGGAVCNYPHSYRNAF